LGRPPSLPLDRASASCADLQIPISPSICAGLAAGVSGECRWDRINCRSALCLFSTNGPGGQGLALAFGIRGVSDQNAKRGSSRRRLEALRIVMLTAWRAERSGWPERDHPPAKTGENEASSERAWLSCRQQRLEAVMLRCRQSSNSLRGRSWRASQSNIRVTRHSGSPPITTSVAAAAADDCGEWGPA